jgi:hypothetical protein
MIARNEGIASPIHAQLTAVTLSEKQTTSGGSAEIIREKVAYFRAIMEPTITRALPVALSKFLR